MPANTSPYIKEFLNQTPVITASLGDTLITHTGNRDPKLYQKPTAFESTKTQDLCKTLQEFENNALAAKVDPVKTRALMQKINTLVKELELQMIRPKEAGEQGDWIMFTPKIIDPKKPLKMHASLLYRFGFVIDQAVKDANYTVNNLAVVSEHAGQDGTERVVADLFVKCKAKFSLINFLKPHTVPNPVSGQQIKYFTDPAHSNTTIFLPMLKTLLQEQFREIPVMIMHGMGDPEGVEYQVLLGNCFGKYRRDGWRSFANMLAVSFGIEDYFTSAKNKEENKPSPVVAVCSQIPNFVLKGDKTVPMSATQPRELNGALRWPGSTINTNVTGHIGYYAESVMNQLIAKGYQLPSDRMIHVELTGYIRSNSSPNSPNRDKFVSVVQRAMNMYRYYDAAIHDPHKLSSRFADRSKNMKLYPELFQQHIIDRYKTNKKEIYDRDTAAYKAEWAKNKQLPPPVPTTAPAIKAATVNAPTVTVGTKAAAVTAKAAAAPSKDLAVKVTPAAAKAAPVPPAASAKTAASKPPKIKEAVIFSSSVTHATATIEEKSITSVKVIRR